MADKFTILKRGGYDPHEVDAYIEKLEAVIKSYKSKDAAIKNAFINAQIAADNIVRNAEIEADRRRESSVNQIKDIGESISTQKNMLNDFYTDYNAMLSKYLHTVNGQDINNALLKIERLEQYLAKLAKDDYAAKPQDAPNEAQAASAEDVASGASPVQPDNAGEPAAPADEPVQAWEAEPVEMQS